MANLPRFGRAWNRFPSLARPSSTQPAYEQEPGWDTALTTKTLQPFEPNPPPKVTSLPSSPVRESTWHPSPNKKQPSPSPSSSPKYKPTTTRVTTPPSPIKPAASSRSPPLSRYAADGHRISPNSSPKHTKTSQRRSPKYRSQPTAPVSPLILPRSEIKPASSTLTRSRSPPEVEHKRVLYTEKSANYDRKPEYGSGKPTHKQQADVININGENVGAVMHISRSSEGEEIIKKKQRESDIYGNDDRETNRKDEKTKKMSSLPMKSFMNSNFQGVNNSLMYNSSCSHRDPGLHLAFSGKKKHDLEESVFDSRR